MSNKKEYNREYRIKNKEKLSLKMLEWQRKNRDKCHKYNKKWYQKNKERNNLRSRKWATNNRERVVEIVQKYTAKNIEKVKEYRKSFEQTMEGRYRQLMWRAKHYAGIPITFEEFKSLMSQVCIYCGDNGKVGIDRINNKNGYIKLNSAPCCKLCNFMKKALSAEQFITHVRKIYKHNS